MSPHTPGPWRLWLAGDDPGAFELHGDSPEPHCDNMVIAQRNIGTPNGDEGVANARLMAAAPDLLSALKAVMHGFESGVLCRNTDSDGLSDWAIKAAPSLLALGMARVAIAKADGLEGPQATNAVDPHAQPSGTPSPREKEG